MGGAGWRNRSGGKEGVKGERKGDVWEGTLEVEVLREDHYRSTRFKHTPVLYFLDQCDSELFLILFNVSCLYLTIPGLIRTIYQHMFAFVLHK